MLGTDVNPGIIPRTVNGIFHSIRSNRWKQPDGQQWEFKISFSYLEIYQEKVSAIKERFPKLSSIHFVAKLS